MKDCCVHLPPGGPQMAFSICPVGDEQAGRPHLVVAAPELGNLNAVGNHRIRAAGTKTWYGAAKGHVGVTTACGRGRRVWEWLSRVGVVTTRDSPANGDQKRPW
ncbi:unnamed protein product [Rangifer tarandus platyrhynchus]|uniref:Uncharacterized protein n=1 Tax=Rangifer tarandus platyrhynchus TaxID=3082113 RepID=A0ABN8YIJ2_RANTA|nr:unnamed protein product [Rangifer tarandus platyrhynchus]